MLTKDGTWTAAPELIIYGAALAFGVPLSMWEFWNLGKTSIMFGLAALWFPSIALLIYDLVHQQVSKGSMFLFFVWIAVVVAYGVYAHVV